MFLAPVAQQYGWVVCGIFIEGDKWKPVKGDNSLLRRGQILYRHCATARFIHKAVSNWPTSPPLRNSEWKQGYFTSFEEHEKGVFWQCMDVITCNIDLLHHNCYLRLLSSCMNKTFAILSLSSAQLAPFQEK